MAADDHGPVAAASSVPVAPAIPAATVVLLREVPSGPEVLMLKKNRGQAFGGNWVFPGGKVEPADAEAAGPDAEEVEVARHAAVREAAEETGVVLAPGALVPFSHWVPPPETPKRFSTWFFVAELPAGAADVVIDGGEIGDHVWTTPAGALARHADGEIELAPPTWMSLTVMAEHTTTAAALAHAAAEPISFYATRIGTLDGAIVTMWEGDAGYETSDPSLPGPRRRVVMLPGGWVYEADGSNEG
jgi:8-oxo-dGTP pyrophosphatase MutT (NUDIX family)